jgi:hypothetical protein
MDRLFGAEIALAVVAASVVCGQAMVRAETYYVSTEGNDTNAGRSDKTAWRTIAHGAKQAKAGDTVLVAPGDYGAEQVVFSNSGEEGKPIVVKGYGGRPKLSSDEKGAIAFLIDGKSHIRIESFEIAGYTGARVKVTKSSHCWVRDMYCLGPGGCLNFTQGVEESWFDGCYVEDTPWNAIMVLGSLPAGAPPSPNNTVTNCVAVRGGHASIDIHTNCADAYVVGCIARERGKDMQGKQANGGLYVHNAPIARPRIIGNAVTDVMPGLAVWGGTDGLIADNLVYDTIWGISDVRSNIDAGVTLSNPKDYLFTGREVFADNITFDVKTRPGIKLWGSKDNVVARNYVDGKNAAGDPDYQCLRYYEADSTGNAIVDPFGGQGSIAVKEGSFTLKFSHGFDPEGTRYRLVGGGKTVEKTFGPEGASFGKLASGTYSLEAMVPGALPAPLHLRVAVLPEADGGAVVVWGDYCSDESGYVVERRLADEKEFKKIGKVEANATRYVDKDVGRRKAFYRVRTLRGEEQSEPSNADEIVRCGYWFTDRTGLAVDGDRAFAQVENGALKTLIAEKAKRVERKAEAEEGVSAFALLEAAADGKTEASVARAAPKQNGKAQVWLVASKPVTATLRWRAGFIRGHVEGEGGYALELAACGGMVKDASFNGKPAKIAFDEATKRARLELSGSGFLQLRCGE